MSISTASVTNTLKNLFFVTCKSAAFWEKAVNKFVLLFPIFIRCFIVFLFVFYHAAKIHIVSYNFTQCLYILYVESLE